MSFGKYLLHGVLHYSGLTRLGYVASPQQKVLSYHNIMPDHLQTDALYDGLTVSVSQFRAQLLAVSKARRFSHVLGEPGTVMVTFDDGNLNNFECARPILNEMGIRAYFFVPLDTALHHRAAWPDLICLWCDRSAPGEATPGGVEGAAIDDEPASRVQASNTLMHLASSDRALQRAICDDIMSWVSLSPDAQSEYIKLRFHTMSAGQLETLKDDGHLIGAHSVYHDRLSALAAEDLAEDMRDCASAIGNVYNTSVYCYPFGGPGEVDDRVAEACRQAGFSAAFINTPDPLPGDLDRYGLPRVTLLKQHGSAGVHSRLSGVEDRVKAVLRR